MKYLIALCILISPLHAYKGEFEKVKFEKVEFKGHTYIVLSAFFANTQPNFIHDPDCKCKNK